ncbi:trans-aconitate 2-methyltransferase [Streptomyces sp. DH37]|uniref:class I SAM-dependent methyltransferase n=1 Tax=Streptomyces sp. DH37 TaxID=3040122 RepID=UPI002442345A|nr:class I SAM-dependent methyltransferase [Streptomyces sp. DH37]MDG9704187.1 class I SAM-dependent methyltransferase [Streptomyces sp. DH37]
MVDRAYSDPVLAALYDALNPWGPGDDFHLGLVMSAASVLDVGCGTGALLRRARAAGHGGRLCGLDPAAAMLARAREAAARERVDVEWVLGDLGSASWEREFELVVMTGHAFQVLLGDEEVRTALAAVRSALADGGRFAFETRNPAARPWERWTPEHAVEVADGAGATVRVAHRVEEPVEGDAGGTGGTVRFTTTFTGPGWERDSRSELRFPDMEALDGFLSGAGLTVVERYGDWGRGPLTAASPEIVTVAAVPRRRGGDPSGFHRSAGRRR